MPIQKAAAGPFLSELSTRNRDNTGPIKAIYTGTGTLVAGVATITLPDGGFSTATSYAVFVQPSGTLVATADSLQVVSRTASAFVVNSIAAGSPMAAESFDWVAIGS
jgi:hypothetical protein